MSRTAHPGAGSKFAERVYEIKYADTTPLAGLAPAKARSLDPSERDLSL